MIRALLILAGTFAALVAEDVPRPLLAAVMLVETRSHFDGDRIVYCDKRDGAAGETGPFQLSRTVCRQWRIDRARLRYDMPYALAAAKRHMLWLRAALGSWDAVPAAFNAGLSGRNRPSAIAYADRVKRAEGN